jgi:predicted enzyme related to lactoylglutathione lyase
MGKNAICHIEWRTTDLDKTKAFLSGMFDWKFKDWGEGYSIFKPPEGVGGGIEKVDELCDCGSKNIIVMVDEIEPYLEKATKLGGLVKLGKTDIPGVGWHALVADPVGVTVGLYESLKK